MATAKRGTRSAGKAARSGLIVATKAAALAANRKKLASLEGLIRRRLATVVESFYDVGVALREILEKKLYAVKGHASLADYLTATKLVSLTQAEKLIAIVRRVPREEAMAAGQERAYALIALADATPEPDTAGGRGARGAAGGRQGPAQVAEAGRAAARGGARDRARRARHPDARTGGGAARARGLNGDGPPSDVGGCTHRRRRVAAHVAGMARRGVGRASGGGLRGADRPRRSAPLRRRDDAVPQRRWGRGVRRSGGRPFELRSVRPTLRRRRRDPRGVRGGRVRRPVRRGPGGV
ncbi:MAG: hypothetical protein IPF99_18850 [Deltaproteobacteria bacterium]|nr:hypothetical protein [Deltaproteobacteria bacterium]